MQQQVQTEALQAEPSVKLFSSFVVNKFADGHFNVLLRVNYTIRQQTFTYHQVDEPFTVGRQIINPLPSRLPFATATLVDNTTRFRFRSRRALRA